MKFKTKDGTVIEGEPVDEESIKSTPSNEVAIGSYEFIHNIEWYDKEEVLITDEPDYMIFVNQKFADRSKFGEYCVFIKCKFGFDSKFGSCSEFSSGCKKQTPYWDEKGKHN